MGNTTGRNVNANVEVARQLMAIAMAIHKGVVPATKAVVVVVSPSRDKAGEHDGKTFDTSLTGIMFDTTEDIDALLESALSGMLIKQAPQVG